MAQTATAPVKKKMSTKKKALIIVFSILAALVVLIVAAGITALNIYCKPIAAKAPISVTQSVSAQQGKPIRLIAHRGLSAQAPENTIAATTAAGKAGFWGAETDIYRTTDGVWVLLHDNYLYRLMEGSGLKKADAMTYEELLEYTYTNGANIDQYPNLKISTLSDYLDECKKYGMTPVIEYKSKNNYEYLHEVIEMIQQKGMQQDVVIISFQLDALQEFQKYTKNEVPLWYLVHELNEEAIQQALSLGPNAGIDFKATSDKLTQENVQKAIDSGLAVGCWTVDSLELLDKMVSWGVNTVTTNVITPDAANPQNGVAELAS